MDAELLRRARRLHDFTQDQLAERAGIRFWRLSRIERGLVKATADEQRRLVAALPLVAQALAAAATESPS